MSRYPPIPPAQQTPEQKQAQAEIESLGSIFGGPLTRKDGDGTMLGPFVPMLYSPQSTQPFAFLASVIPNLPHLTPRVRELAILACAATYEAPFVLYAHSRIALAVGLTPGQITVARGGSMPSGLDRMEQAAWQYSIRLAGTRGPLDTATWENAKNLLGIEGVANLGHVIGAYSYMCLFHNAADIGAPDEQKM
ncbi:MAG: hypothetical protein Q9225_007466 [Loekoesia sp. 1 TL-2023]